MNSYAPSASNEFFLDKKRQEEATDEKTLAERAAIKLKHYYTYVSQRIDGSLSKIGRQRIGASKQQDNSENAVFANRDLSFAMMMISQPLIQSWDSVKDFITSAYSFTTSTALPSNYHPAVENTPFSYTTTFNDLKPVQVSNAFLNAINLDKSTSIQNAEITSEQAFKGLSKGHLVYASHITKAYNAAQGDADIAKHNIKTVYLKEEHGYCFSQDHNDHLISRSKLAELHKEFMKENNGIDTSDGQNTIWTFNRATLNTPPATPQPTLTPRAPIGCFAA